MKSVWFGSALLVLSLLAACSSVQETRKPDSVNVSAMSALNENYFINCNRGMSKSDTSYIVLNKDASGDYILKAKKYNDKTPWVASAACQEKDNGLTCFAKDGIMFRIDYVFTERIYGELTYSKVKFGLVDDYSCNIWATEQYRARHM